MSTLLASLALLLLPVFPLLGGGILLFGLFRETLSHSLPKPKYWFIYSSRSEKIAWTLLLVSSSFPLFVCVYPSHHLTGLLSHYLLPAWICWVFTNALNRGSLERILLRKNLLRGLGLLAGVALLNYFGDWHGQIQAFPLPVFDRPYLLDLSLPPAQGRAAGPALNPNLLGLLMVMGWPLVIHESVNHGQTLKRWTWFGLGVLLLLTAGVSFSRSAWLGLIAAQLLLLTTKPPLRQYALLCLGLETGFLLLPQIQSRLHSIFATDHSTNELRMQIWQAGLLMLTDFWSTGTGLLQFEWLYPAYQIAQRNSAHLHNMFLQISVESGLFFALALFYLAFRLFYNSAPQKEIQASWLALALFCCFDFPLADLRVQVFLSVLLALQLSGNSLPVQPGKSLRTAEGIC